VEKTPEELAFDDAETSKQWFLGDNTITKVTIPEGVKKIGAYAFANLTALEEIVLPSTLEAIEYGAFVGCSSLQKITFSGENNLKIINQNAFENCDLQGTVDLSSICVISDYAFAGNQDLEGIKTSDTLLSIGRYAFYGCTEVQQIMIPASVKTIGDYAFRGCTKVDAVILPETIDVIGKHAFYGLSKASFFCESDTIRPYWHERWNSSYRTVFWGCTLSEDGTYVVAITAGESMIDNLNAPDSSLTPEREGYFLDGWATEAGSDDVAFTSWNLIAAPEGTVLYAVWKQEAISD
jgi:hypothetical protein